MKHIDEHVLELYVLQAPEVAPRREEISAHLEKCQGCRDLAAEMSEFYADVNKEENRHPTGLVGRSRGMLRRRSDLSLFNEPYAQPIVQVPKSVPARMLHFARNHPVVAGGATFSGLAVVAMAMSMFLRVETRDLTPEYAFINTTTGALEVHNRKNEILWQKPLLDAGKYATSEIGMGVKYSYVGDLLGHGHRELVSVLPFKNVSNEQNWARVLRVFENDSTIRWSLPIGARSTYHGMNYGMDFGCDGLVVLDGSESGEKEVIVDAVQWRSPTVVMRVDGHGNVLGEYWHFGHLGAMQSIDLHRDGKKQVVLIGKNDVQDSVGGDFAVVVVLDPLKINGKTESTVTPGFGYSPSQAELFYVRLPDPDVNTILGTTGASTRVRLDDPDFLRVFYSTSYTGPLGPEGAPSIEYSFTKQMAVSEVKLITGGETLYANLKKMGKSISHPTAKYLEDLSARVQYWNGKQWSRDVATVSQR